MATSSNGNGKNQEEPAVVVQNPFELKRDFYDRNMWYDYKDELSALGYTMIEYDWLILDNITFTIEGTYDFASCYVFVFDGVMQCNATKN